MDASAQDFCASTQVLQGYFNYPLPQVSWIGSHVILASDLGALDMEELRIDALIAPDGQSLGEVTLSGLIGATQLSSYFGVDYCQSMSAQGSPCVGCQDPQGCARVRVEQATGRVKGECGASRGRGLLPRAVRGEQPGLRVGVNLTLKM